MQMSGERLIAADRVKVWAALNDPDVLKECIPGCQEMTKTSPTAFEAKVTQKVGPVRANFTGEVELTDIVEGHSYRISGKGKGGAAGGASGGAAVRLEEVPEGTKLAYDAEAKVTGKLAQLGSRLIDGFAKKMADDFFDRFKTQVEGPQTGGDAGGAGEPAAVAGDMGRTDDAGQAERNRQAMEAGADAGHASARADAAVRAGGEDAHAASVTDDERAAREAIARPGRDGPAEPPVTASAPVAGRSAAKAHDAASSAVGSGLESRGVEPTKQKKSWWARLFG